MDVQHRIVDFLKIAQLQARRYAKFEVECSRFAVLSHLSLMSLDIPSIQQIDGSGLRFAIIASRYNEALVDSLVQHASATLTAAGAEPL